MFFKMSTGLLAVICLFGVSSAQLADSGSFSTSITGPILYSQMSPEAFAAAIATQNNAKSATPGGAGSSSKPSTDITGVVTGALRTVLKTLASLGLSVNTVAAPLSSVLDGSNLQGGANSAGVLGIVNPSNLLSVGPSLLGGVNPTSVLSGLAPTLGGLVGGALPGGHAKPYPNLDVSGNYKG